ncbi:Cell division protein ZapA [Beijerinckiaceae bacterium RH AL1]|nr:cell division protein ZapA [Beijerinckiaceae bacterium]VVB42551.1 Cell division protein ZapA [Beijerinckiaceae bacterium RH AL8]VVB42552.1 Cell division protein ZapA [Beijerinckiaceae bacterium RH CH11]VVC53366.1 Cell division protein ZapA [Beijerinckiaceae bacterium RH AL1]
MATVGVTIAGRTYRMACGEGEEGHLQELARHVDATLAGLRKGFGEIGDTRLVIMTAITVADELFEARRRAAEVEARLAELSESRSEGEALRDALALDVAGALDAASTRLERLAQHLNEAGKA